MNLNFEKYGKIKSAIINILNIDTGVNAIALGQNDPRDAVNALAKLSSTLKRLAIS
ncbi:MAG: hypothetical protein E7K04_01640 [Helicobacter sp.]|nr:hypothetical protein [Helicobacter sp.]